MDRKLEVGLINIMPNPKGYKELLDGALKNIHHQLNIHPIKLSSNTTNGSKYDVDSQTFDNIIQKVSLDLLIITGAPVEHLDYADVLYWDELCQIINYGVKNFTSILGICFGGLVIAKSIGIEKKVLKTKLFGSFELDTFDEEKRYFKNVSKKTHMPISSWAVLDKYQVEGMLGKELRSLAYSESVGFMMLETLDNKLLMILGHPEYKVETLIQEWERDVSLGKEYAIKISRDEIEKMGHKMHTESATPILDWVNNHYRQINKVGF